MHEDELEIGEPLVPRLLAEQFPQWADPPLHRLDPTGKTRGTVNEIFRLGDEFSVRLPRRRGPTEAGSNAPRLAAAPGAVPPGRATLRAVTQVGGFRRPERR